MKTLLVALLVICTNSSAFAGSNCVVAVDSRHSIPQEFNELFLKNGYQINYVTSIEVCSVNGSCRTKFLNSDMSPASYGYYFEFNYISKRQYGPTYKTEVLFASSNNEVLYSKSKRGQTEPQKFFGEFSKALKACE